MTTYGFESVQRVSCVVLYRVASRTRSEQLLVNGTVLFPHHLKLDFELVDSPLLIWDGFRRDGRFQIHVLAPNILDLLSTLLVAGLIPRIRLLRQMVEGRQFGLEIVRLDELLGLVNDGFLELADELLAEGFYRVGVDVRESFGEARAGSTMFDEIEEAEERLTQSIQSNVGVWVRDVSCCLVGC